MTGTTTILFCIYFYIYLGSLGKFNKDLRLQESRDRWGNLPDRGEVLFALGCDRFLVVVIPIIGHRLIGAIDQGFRGILLGHETDLDLRARTG
jgi:hypothetical protein